MPATANRLSTHPEEAAAWASLMAAEEALEAVLRKSPELKVEVCGQLYYLDETQRMVCAPAYLDGTPDRDNERHRSEYEGMGVEDMTQAVAEIEAWLSGPGLTAQQDRPGCSHPKG